MHKERDLFAQIYQGNRREYEDFTGGRQERRRCFRSHTD